MSVDERSDALGAANFVGRQDDEIDAKFLAYHSALELSTEALRTLGYHPFRAEKLRVAFDQREQEGRDALYNNWQDKSDGERYGTSFRELYIELEETLARFLQQDRDDRHSRSERGWTPPPKGYAEVIKDDGP